MDSSPTRQNIKDYVDWFAEVSRQGGELAWILRTKHFYTPESASKSLTQVNQAVLASPVVRAEIAAEIARRSGESKAAVSVEAEARQILAEMEHNFQLDVVRSIGYALLKAIRRMYKSIFVNMERLQAIRQKCEHDARIVFLPTHRSYMDFLLLSLLCFHADVPLPAICAGEDFRASALLGGVLRRCGAFYIRRTFGNDKLYWAIFSEYVQAHVIDNLRPVEFFVEGMRSRSGKSLYPKTGLLQTVLQPFFTSDVFDILLVPVTINYDRLLEENLYARELLGTPKPKETASGLFKARDVMRDNFGNIYVTFADAISVRDHFSNCEAARTLRTHHSFASRGALEWNEEGRAAVRRLAHVLIETHQRHSVLTVWPLMCLTILRHNCYLTRLQLLEGVENLRALMERLFVNVTVLTVSVDSDIREIVTLNFAPDAPASERIARRLLLFNYDNAVITSVVSAAFIATSAIWQAHNKTRTTVTDILSDFRMLTKLYDHEFICVPNEIDRKFDAALQLLCSAQVFSIQNDIVNVKDVQALDEIWALAKPWIECYTLLMRVSICILADNPLEANGAIVAQCQQETARIMQERGLFRFDQAGRSLGDLHVVCLSYDTIRNVFAFLKEHSTFSNGRESGFNFSQTDTIIRKLDAFVYGFALRIRPAFSLPSKF